MRALPRITIPLLVGIALLLPLAACVRAAGDEAAVTGLDHQYVSQG